MNRQRSPGITLRISKSCMDKNLRHHATIAMIEPVCAHGGMDYYDYSLLQRLQKAGMESRFYTSKAGPLAPRDIFIAETFKGVYGDAPRLYRAAKWILALRKSIDDAVKHGAKLVHYHFFDTSMLERMSIWLAWRRGLKIVATIHDVESFHKKRDKADAALFLSSLDGVIVHNEISREEVSRLVNERPVALTVIPHGNYIGYIGDPMSREEARKNLGLPRKGSVFLFFGQIKKVKGLEVALKALNMVIKKSPETVLLIAGKMWKDDATIYQEMIQGYGLTNNVAWHDGYVPQERVDWYYYASDAVVLPYRRIYQSGVLLMAMSYGLPVIASDLPGMREVITHDDNGYLFATGDHAALAERIAHLIQEPQTARMIGERGREYVLTHHDWSIIGDKTVEFYRKVMEEV